MIIKIVKIISIVFVLAGIIAAGFYLRVSNPNRFTAKTYNVNAYYFYKSQYLNDFGRLPQKDVWSFAPEVFPENVPPLLAYGTVGTFKLAKLFKSDVDFYDFAMLFPVIIYALWAFFGFWLIIRLFNDYISGFIFAGLLTVMPLSFDLTVYGRYTEENLGAFLFFISLIFLVKFIEKKMFFYWPVIFSLTAFYLTWQQFPLFLAGLLFVGLVEILKESKNRRKLFIGYALLVVLPLVFGHLISRYLIKIDYSPVSMVYEAFLGIKNMNSEFVRIAMSRQDWRNLYLGEFIALIGFAGWVLAGAGFLRSILRWKESKFRIILIFFVLTLAIAVKFFKSRYLVTAPFLLVASSASELFFKKSQKDWQRLIDFSRPARGFFAKLFSRAKMIFYPAALIVIISLLSFYILFYKNGHRFFPQPAIFISSSQKFEIAQAYQVEIKLTNQGGDSFQDPAAFGGLHIEVENAEVENIVSWADQGESQVVIKPDALRENIYWFEAKFPGLKAGESGYVWFKVAPGAVPINVYYRGWLPGEPTFWQRLKTLTWLISDYRNWQNSWRSEEAVQRSPANNDASQELCPVKVYAAHKDIQDFRCFLEAFN